MYFTVLLRLNFKLKNRAMWRARGRREMLTKFQLKSLEGKDHSEDLGIGGRIKLRWILGVVWLEIVDCIHLAQDRDRYWAPVNTAP
jgi:hypothetical protein